MAYSVDECLEAVRRAAGAAGGPLTIHAYRGWRAAASGPVPNDLTIVRHLGSWPEALRAAGVASSTYTAEDCLEALRAAAGYLGTSELTQAGYRAWRDTQERAPEQQTIRARLGPWATAVAAAGLTSGR